MIGRNGQMGKILTSFPTLIGIFIVIGLFLFLSATLAGLRGPNLEKAYFESGEDNLLLKKVDVHGRKMLVFEVIVDYKKEKIEREEVSNVLKGLVNSGECLLLASGLDEESGSSLGGDERKNFIFENLGDRMDSLNPGSFHSVFARYRDKELLTQLRAEVSGKEIYIEYYYGGCLE